METVFVAQRRGHEDLLLLAEMGLHDEVNVAFDRDGREVRLGRVAFAEESERELPFDSDLLTPEQRLAYLFHWARREQTAAVSREIEQVWADARRHPVRHGLERRGGQHLARCRSSSVRELDTSLRAWLRVAVDEDVVGDIGTYAGQTWLEAPVPDARTGAPIPLQIHADSKAGGVARFLCFVIRCGGPENVRATRDGGRLVLMGLDGQHQLESGQWFFFSQN